MEIGPAKVVGKGGRPKAPPLQPQMRVRYRRQYRKVGKHKMVRLHIQPELKVGAPWLRMIGLEIGDYVYATVPKPGILVLSKLPDPTKPKT